MSAARFTHPRYVAGAELGRGAQGAVVVVQDREDPERPLVAKVYHRDLLAEDALRSEFALLARVRAPGLVRAHDLGRCEREGALFLVEDRIDGPDALAWVQAAPDTRLPRLVRVLGGVARTLASLHEAGFLHGDLKPAHVRIAGEQPIVLDLGAAIAVSDSATRRAFSRGFAAPELLAGGRADTRADLYGLGALAWAAAVGRTPEPRPARLRERAPWVPPRIADLIDSLLSIHPEDRLQSALAVLERLGQSAAGGESLAIPIGRDVEVQRALDARAARVRYLTGDSGSGKSHVLREVRVAALLAGRDTRLLVPREDSAAQVAHWASRIREAAAVATRPPSLLLVDSLEDAPEELRSAIESYRVLAPPGASLQIIAATATAPPRSESIALPPLSQAALSQLAMALGATPDQRERLIRAAAGSPGWLVAALGRVPITSPAVLARTRELTPEAVGALALVALVGGTARSAWLQAVIEEPTAACAALARSGLLRRRGIAPALVYELEAPSIARELASALAEPDLIERIARVLLDDTTAEPGALLALATAAAAPTRCSLLTAAATSARHAHARDLEIDALLGLATEAAARSYQLLARLERLLRDAARLADHARVVGWLEEAASTDTRIRTLSLRRSAEQAARTGEPARALEWADSALALARELEDPLGLAQAFATRGAVQLYNADHARASADLDEAQRRFAALDAGEDREELARLEHNLGVIALYRGELAVACARFEAALRTKQQLGDRAGMRACLRNLGYAAVREGRFDDAARWLEQALALARSLQQVAGEAWSLVSLAELEVRRGNGSRAERHLAEIEALGEAAPAAVRADVALVRGEIALAAGEPDTFDALVESVDPAARSGDPQVDASWLILSARAALLPPVGRNAVRTATRLALRALRKARGAQLALIARDAEQVVHAALEARRRLAASSGGRSPNAERLDRDFLAALAASGAAQPAALFARHALAALGAERVFVLAFAGQQLVEAVAVDLDGLAIGEAERRFDARAAARARMAPREAVRSECADGRGSRLAFAAPSLAGRQLVMLAEQRFVAGAFDAHGAERVAELSVLLALCARVWAGAEPRARTSAEPVVTLDPTSTTSMGLRAARRSFPGIIGNSRALRSALARLDAAVDSDLPLLLTGETGVGKELFARAVAELGPRSHGPFVAVNCGAIAPTLFQAELFGHERGAFTGADRKRTGVLLQADKGVLLLDEIGDLPLAQQVALLRALETQRVRPLGDERERSFDARLIAATNCDLERAVAEGRFRQDLLYRINVLEVRVPSLRERSEDIELLAQHFLHEQGSALELSSGALQALLGYHWPGNVRELAHVMQRLSRLHGPRIEVSHLPRQLRSKAVRQPLALPVPDRALDPRSEVLQTLEQTGGNISHAARVLGLTRHGLKKRMLRLGLRAQTRGDTP